MAVDTSGVSSRRLRLLAERNFTKTAGRIGAARTTANGGSALSYIPEIAWNDSSASNGFAPGGGGSFHTFPKPSWQTGTGVPNDGFRMCRSVAIAAPPVARRVRRLYRRVHQYYGGTSIGAPMFSGIMALLNQYLVSTGIREPAGRGQYQSRHCTGWRKTRPGIFHDITSGDNIVTCADESPNCSGGSFGYRPPRHTNGDRTWLRRCFNLCTNGAARRH